VQGQWFYGIQSPTLFVVHRRRSENTARFHLRLRTKDVVSYTKKTNGGGGPVSWRQAGPILYEKKTGDLPGLIPRGIYAEGKNEKRYSRRKNLRSPAKAVEKAVQDKKCRFDRHSGVI